MNFNDLILKGTASLREKQNYVNKAGSFKFKYSLQNKTLYVTAKVRSANSEAVYDTILTVYGISWERVPDKMHRIEYIDEGSGNKVFLSLPTGTHNCGFRCTCLDYRFMWMYPNKSVKSLVGRALPYVRKTSHLPPRNPDNVPGVCKHSLSTIKFLYNNRVLFNVVKIREYIQKAFRK